MANLLTNILPIEVDLKPEARAKPGPDRSQDPARFQRHLENSASDRPQRSERSSLSRPDDPQPAERKAASHRHRKSEPADKPNRLETPSHDGSGEVAKLDQAHKTHSEHTRIADDDRSEALRSVEPVRTDAVQKRASEASDSEASDSIALSPEQLNQTALTTPDTDSAAVLTDSLLNEGGAEQIAAAQIDPDIGANIIDTPDPEATSRPTPFEGTTQQQEPAAGGTTDQPLPAAPATPDAVPDPAHRRPSLPEAALNGLPTAALNIPDHYSGQGRPAELLLIQNLPPVPEDQPFVTNLPETEPQADDLLAADLPEFAVQPEAGEPLAFETPDPEIEPIGTAEHENTDGNFLPAPATAAITPEDGQPVPASSTEAIPVEPLPVDVTIPSTAELDAGTDQKPVTPEPLDTAIAPATQPAAPQPVVGAVPNAAETKPVAAQASAAPARTEGPATATPVAPAPTERLAGITPPVQTAPAAPLAQAAAPAATSNPTAAVAADPVLPSTEPAAQPQIARPGETGRPAESLMPQNPAPGAGALPVTRADAGLLSQLASTDPLANTPPARPATTTTSPANPDTATTSTFDKALLNAAAATPQQTAAINTASITATPPLGTEAPLSDVPVSAQTGSDSQSTTAPVAQNAHNVSIRFGMSPQLGANGQTPVNTLAFNIAKNFDNGVTRFQVRIDPPELGRVDVKLDMTVEGRVRAHLTVERSETLELMMRDARSLEKALADTGLNLTKDSLSFSLKDQNAFSREGGGFGNETGDPSAPDTPPTITDEPLPEQMTRGYISDSGVDIKV